jgi:putative DNA primase/helicase
MTDALTSAYQYTEKRHWRLVAVKNGTKRPPADGWQNLRLEASDLPRYFSNGASIGVLCGEPSGNLVDVDLDCREAVALASHFLPKTALRHGRPGNPDSHLWYTCKPLPDTTKFRDPERPKEYGMIVEFRSTGTQTVVPPSLHPDGEAYLWHADGRPTEIDGRALLNAVSALAAAALLARYWPGSGSRQDAALALAGGLLRAEWEEDAVSHFVQAVATAAGDEEARKRATAGGFTSKRLTAEKRATGWPTLAELVGDKVADKRATSRYRLARLQSERPMWTSGQRTQHQRRSTGSPAGWSRPSCRIPRLTSMPCLLACWWASATPSVPVPISK